MRIFTMNLEIKMSRSCFDIKFSHHGTIISSKNPNRIYAVTVFNRIVIPKILLSIKYVIIGSYILTVIYYLWVNM